jgi:SAM-dependent methyltransferase
MPGGAYGIRLACTHGRILKIFDELMDQRPATVNDQFTVSLYTRLVKQYGLDHRSLDWGSVASQELRFAVLAGVGPLEGASILDVGCGFADFWPWLKQRVSSIRYTGIDITPAMIRQARQRFPDLRLETTGMIELARCEPKGFDYVMASGIFAHRQHRPVEDLRESIRLFLQLARRGVAFNSLSAWASHQDAGEFYSDPLETVSFCRSLTERVVLRHDYHSRDFTIYLYPSTHP